MITEQPVRSADRRHRKKRLEQAVYAAGIIGLFLLYFHRI